jgi:hypothetical protein
MNYFYLILRIDSWHYRDHPCPETCDVSTTTTTSTATATRTTTSTNSIPLQHLTTISLSGLRQEHQQQIESKLN